MTISYLKTGLDPTPETSYSPTSNVHQTTGNAGHKLFNIHIKLNRLRHTEF